MRKLQHLILPIMAAIAAWSLINAMSTAQDARIKRTTQDDRIERLENRVKALEERAANVSH